MPRMVALDRLPVNHATAYGAARDDEGHGRRRRRDPRLVTRVPGLGAALVAVALATLLGSLVPAVPVLTAAVALGVAVGQLPAFRDLADGVLAPGLELAARTLMRAGIVLLGLRLSLVDIADLGLLPILAVVTLVVVTFLGTWWIGRRMGLPGDEPLLVAAGFSVCGASAIGAMAGATRATAKDQATPVALVTLCGTLAIGVLPALMRPLGLDDLEFGRWVGAGVHDVGQVVATAQIAGPAALAVAVVVKLTRVLMLAPMVAVAASVRRRADTASGEETGPRPPLVPLFVLGFLAAVLVNTLLPVPDALLTVADTAQTIVLAAALFALGTGVRIFTLVRTGWRALIVGLVSWTLIAVLAYVVAVHVA